MDDAPRFDLGFDGSLHPGADPQTARTQLQRAFKLNDKAVERLFSGRLRTIRRGVDEQTRLRFERLFASAGAILQVIPAAGPPSDDATTEVAAPPRQEPDAAGTRAQPRSEAPGASPALALAQEGPLESPPDSPAPAIDTSHLSLMSASDWSFADCAAPPPDMPAPDISHLALVDLDPSKDDR